MKQTKVMTEYSSEIRAVLFDADGVVQCAIPGWLENLGQMSHGQNNNEQILTEIFEAEKTSLTDHVAFEVPLECILSRWGSSVSVFDALLLWNKIEPDESVLQVISGLRKHVMVGLATNQQRHRAKFMLSDLGYAKLFDHIFITCEMGYVKSAKKSGNARATILCSFRCVGTYRYTPEVRIFD